MSDLPERGPRNDEELLLWIDPATWAGYGLQAAWNEIDWELHSIKLHQYTLRYFLRGPEVEELQRIEQAWADEGFPPPWQGLIDVNSEKK